MWRKLFPKLFAWYLLGTTLVVGVTLAFDLLGESEQDRESRRRMWYANVTLAQGQRAVDAYERGGIEALTSQLARLEQNTGIRGLLYSWDGDELSGLPSTEDDKSLAVRAALTDDFQFDSRGATPLVAACVGEADHGRFVFIGQMPSRGSLDFLRRPLPLLARLGAALLVAAGVCYALARYLTGPIRRLQSAAVRMAGGDLSVRVSDESRLRRDEIGDLGREFDHMAGRLQNLIELQKRLLRDLSHELRSPLARLNVALELARDASGPGADNALQRIEQESNKLNEMIGQLLTLARLDAGEPSGQPEIVHLAALVRELAADAEYEAAARQVRVRVNSTQDAQIAAAPVLLRSAIENVVRNAIRFTADGTTVAIAIETLRRDDRNRARISVNDQGPGVPEAELVDIFRPFYRVSVGRERTSGGTGLGLAIADRIIRSYGGEARAANRPGGGLCVMIELPCL